MAGHSHASNVKHKKAASASKRAKLFTRLARDITSAVKQGGSDNPDINPKLKVVLDRARRLSLPRDNIDRAIKKASDNSEADNMEDIVYQGFLPGGIAFIVETCTDNRNRTASKMREIFNKFDGALGATDHLFEHVGEIYYKKPADSDTLDNLMLLAIDAGASDVIEMAGEDDSADSQILVTCKPDLFNQIQESLSNNTGIGKMNVEILEAEKIYKPIANVELNDEKKKDITKMLALLEDNEDVEEVWHNISNI